MIKLKKEVIKLLSSATGLPQEEICSGISTPPNSDMGDLSFPCFKLSKVAGNKPNEVADDVVKKIQPCIDKGSVVETVVSKGPYVNFTAKRSAMYNEMLSFAVSLKSKGFRKDPNKKNIVIDYSSPNIAKPIAFHHIRSTMIGSIIGNIFESLGYNVIRINYLGDWGTQFGKLITAFEEFGERNLLEKQGVKHLLDIYVKYHKAESPVLEEKARTWFKRMETGDEKAISYWKEFRELSIKEFNRVYDRLDVKFTNIEGESFYNNSSESLISKIDDKIGVKESEGALIVDLEAFNMPPVLLKKKDDTTLYATRDLAAAYDRMNRFSFDESLYVVAHQQELHFKQIFKVLELMDCDWFSKCKHIQFGLLHLAEGKMSTREGNVVFLEDVIDKAVILAEKAISEKNPDLENKKEVAEAIGVGSIIFGDISKRRTQDIVFNWDEILNFDGETAPYVQYTHARACSMLSKAGYGELDIKSINNYSPDDLEYELIKLILQFEDKLEEAKREYEPFVLARYVLDICRVFNRYYYQEKIIDIEDDAKRMSKLALVYSSKETIKEVLKIIGIKAPQRM